MLRAGFTCKAAIDFNRQAVDTLRSNLAEVEHALHRDLTSFSPAELAGLIGCQTLDVIVGGPPCQGFSTARQVDGANHGNRLKNDPRRHLYQEFLRHVDYFQPKVFVMENVLGLRSAAGGEYFTRVQKEARELGASAGRPGYRVHDQIEDAWELGVPQKRRRQLIIGVRNDLPGYFLPILQAAPRAMPRTNLGAAIGDLPRLKAGSGCDEREYDTAKLATYLRRANAFTQNYLTRVLEIHQSQHLTNHVARPHSARDLRDFARLREGENAASAARERDVTFESPYDTSSFKDRYTRQSRWAPCSTIVAHLSKDGLMFIHPTQNRSLTPREAARIQSFPDWFRFPKARTHSFRLIGNAVPPLIGEAVGLAVTGFMRRIGNTSAAATARHSLAPGLAGQLPEEHISIPRSRAAAALSLEEIAKLDQRALRSLPPEDFLRGWHALLYLFPGLHPDSALDHGTTEETWPEAQLILPGLEQQNLRRYARSGWPVALALIGREAWRRKEAGMIQDNEFYCSTAQIAGMRHQTRKPTQGEPSDSGISTNA